MAGRTVSSSDVLILLVEHIDSLMMLSGARHVPGASSLTNAKAVIRRWSDASIAAFHFVATASNFVTKREIAKASGANFDSLHAFFRKLKTRDDGTGGEKIPVIAADGKCEEMPLFRDGSECIHQNSGTNELGEKVRGGIRIMLGTKRIPFSQAMDAASVNKAVVETVANNADGIAAAVQSGTRREVTQRDRTRSEYERAREARVSGPQLQLLKTGTDGE